MPIGLQIVGEGPLVRRHVEAGDRAHLGIGQRRDHAAQIIGLDAHVAVADHHDFVRRLAHQARQLGHFVVGRRCGPTRTARESGAPENRGSVSRSPAARGRRGRPRRRQARSPDNPAGRSWRSSRRRPGSRPRMGFRLLTGGVKGAPRAASVRGARRKNARRCIAQSGSK